MFPRSVIMTADSSPSLRQELLDDFYAECDEQLGVIRSRLTELEAVARDALPPVATVEALFRNMHSFKGNAAIVGLRAAEEAAHVAEDYLRLLSGGTRPVSEEGLEALLATTQRLEQMVSAHRQHQPLPSVDDLPSRFAALMFT
jgi:two-component system chemotaxis sensor kinase CheA